MSGSSRGKIKEHLEGMHRNCDWIQEHCIQCLALIKDTHPDLSKAFVTVGELAEVLDEFAQEIYRKI